MPEKPIIQNRPSPETDTNLTAMLNIVADGWVLLLLRELYMGATSWSEFVEVLDISPAILNKRLKLLIEAKCLKKSTVSGKRETKYLLTPAGKALFTFIAAAREWQLRWDTRAGAYVSPFVHKCGAPLRTYPACKSCQAPLKTSDVKFSPNAPAIPRIEDSRHFRLSRTTGADRRSPNATTAKIIQILGDRRATQLISALSDGPLKFDEVAKASGLHPAIVTERLRKLQLLGLCQQRLYQERPDRFLYSLTASAQDLFEVAAYLRQWANEWLPSSSASDTGTHLLCGSALHVELRCQSCHEPVLFETITRI